MLFKKKGKQSREDEVASPASMDGEAPTCTNPAGKEAEVASDSKAKDIHTGIIYPSGLKLALLMTSIFVGMFLVSLVC